MPKLDARLKGLATRLLAWDRARVAKVTAQGYDTTLYSARQDLAQASLEIAVEEWPQDVTFLFMSVLEVTRTPNTFVKQAGVGPLKPRVERLDQADISAYRDLAEALGVLWRLMEVAPRRWTEGAQE